jgi:outer membrane protein insertion porin family
MNFKIVIVLTIVITTSPFALAKEFSFKRQVIKKVEIVGNNNFSDGKLKKQLLTKPNRWHSIFSKRKLSRTNLRIDEQQLERFYSHNGFLFTKVKAEVDYFKDDSAKVVVSFNIVEGERVYIELLEVVGGLAKLNNRLPDITKKMQPGEPVNRDAVLSAGYKIRDYYADNGHPLASVRPEFLFLSDSSQVVIHYDIAESCFVYNGEIMIVQDGSNQMNENIISRELLVRAGNPYSKKLNTESQQRLYSTGLLKFVNLKRTGDLRYISPDTTVVDLRLKITGRKANFVNVSFGIKQHQDFNSVLQTSIRWGNRNLWATGRKLIMEARNSLQLTKSGEEETRALKLKDLFSDLKFEPVMNAFEINYVEPWFLGYRMPLSVMAVYEPWNKNPIINKFYDRLSGEVSLLRELDRYTNIRLSGRIEFVDIHDVKKEEEEDFRLEGDNSIRRKISVYGQRDTRDNIFIPQTGSYSYVSLGYVGHYLGGDFSYIKGEFSWSRYSLLPGENILASRLRIGVLEELGRNGRSGSQDRFTLGGAKTVRGFAENTLGPKWTVADNVPSLIGLPKGGKLLLLANLELRRSLFWRFGGTAFIDAGNVFYDIKDLRTKNIVSSAGLGLQFFTPVGPLRFEYAFMLQKELDLAEGSYHLTILYAF